MGKIRTIQQVLQGLAPHRAQTVGNMTVIPLVSDIVDDTIVSPDALEMETVNYGTVAVYNTGLQDASGPTISPLGALIMTTKSAQNHAVPGMRLVKKGGKAVMDNAACIQERQGGLIPRGRYKLRLLPVAMREEALDGRNVRSHGKLWEPIWAFNRSFGLSNVGHLEYFMERFAKEMEQFVAQFEIVPRQVGAIVLINGGVIGIERFPNYRFFKVMWGPLIRECYGSMSIQADRSAGIAALKNRVALDAAGVYDLAGIKAALKKAKVREEAATREVINGFIKNKCKVHKEEKVDGLVLETIANAQLKGQVVRKDQVALMFSFVTTRQWLQNPNRGKVALAGAFRM